MDVFTTRNEAVARLVEEPLRSSTQSLDDFDVEAIADKTIESFTADDGRWLFRSSVDAAGFWEVVRQHDTSQ